MLTFHPDPRQLAASDPFSNRSVFLTGNAGCGKTTAGCQRLLALVRSGVAADSILVIVPQRSLALPFERIALDKDFPTGSHPEIMTFGGIARRMISLFWPVISASAGFRRPHHPPAFLTLETSQYYMNRIVQPMLQRGEFESIKLEPNRLYSQILDNLNKCALVGIPSSGFSEKMKRSLSAEQLESIALDQAQLAASQFRTLCLKNNLLDFSLQIEVFSLHLWPAVLFRRFLRDHYRHLIYDNVEEDAPIFHDMIKEWIPDFQTVLLIVDQGAGYRSFLGADPVSASNLRSVTEKIIQMNESFVSSDSLTCLSNMLQSAIEHRDFHVDTTAGKAFSILSCRHVPETIQAVAKEIMAITAAGLARENEIVVISPYVSDALLFSISREFSAAGIHPQGHRPSRSLHSDTTVSILITLAKLMNPQWDLLPSRYDLRKVFMQVLTDGDFIRADLLAQIMYKPKAMPGPLGSFDSLQAPMRERIGYTIGNRYMRLRNWVLDMLENPADDLDVLWIRLFGEMLSQPDMGFHNSYPAAASTALLIESMRKFRQVMEPDPASAGMNISKEYVSLVDSGLISAFYLAPWSDDPEGVMISPAYTYLLSNRPVKIQFWLDVGSPGWWQRPFQPLTHPYILSRNWDQERLWTDADEIHWSMQSLSRLAAGLLQRCAGKVYFCATEFDEQGNQNKTGLLQALNIITRKSMSGGGDHD